MGLETRFWSEGASVVTPREAMPPLSWWPQIQLVTVQGGGAGTFTVETHSHPVCGSLVGSLSAGAGPDPPSGSLGSPLYLGVHWPH